jgi:hypothetical protein
MAVSIELCYIIWGMKVAITGKRVRMIKQSIIAPTKGQLPLKMVLSGISHTPARAKAFMPTGGVINPISINITVITNYVKLFA